MTDKLQELFEYTKAPVKYAGDMLKIAELYSEILGIITIPVFLKYNPAEQTWSKVINVPWKNIKSFSDAAPYLTEEYLTSKKNANKADGYGLAAIMGLSNYLCVDIDNEELMRNKATELYNILMENKKNTMVVQSINGGLHFYFRKPDNVVIKDKLFSGTYGFDVRAQGLIIIPPSGNEDGYYKWINLAIPATIPNELLELITLNDDKAKLAIETMQKINSQMNNIIEALRPYYVPGNRDKIIFALSGFLRKNQVPIDKAREFITKLTEIFGDEEQQQRLIVLERTYDPNTNPDELLGLSGLAEVIDDANTLREIRDAFRGWKVDVDSRYIIKDNCFYIVKKNDVYERLCPFSARVTRIVTYDDGFQKRSYYTIEGIAADGTPLPPVQVPVDEYEDMKWVAEWDRWGQSYSATIPLAKQKIREAILLFSDFDNIERSTYYLHTGWTEHKDFITSESMDKATVDEASNMVAKIFIPVDDKFFDEEKARKGLYWSIKIAQLHKTDKGTDNYFVPVFFIPYFSTLREFWIDKPPFIFFFHGPSSSYKTTVAKLLLNHYTNQNTNELLFQFTDTANYIEKLAAFMKDVLMVIDDFHPSPVESEQRQMEYVLQRLIRSSTNVGGRGRLSSRGETLSRYVPRATILITGENLINIQSSISRLFITNFISTEIDLELLTQIQENQELLSYGLAMWIRWLRDLWQQDDTFPRELNNLKNKARQFYLRNGKYRRVQETISRVVESFGYFGALYVYFRRFLEDIGMIDIAIENGIYDEAGDEDEDWFYLMDIIDTYIDTLQDLLFQDDPVEAFKELMEINYNNRYFRLNGIGNWTGWIIGDINGRYIGFFDDDYYYFYPQEVWSAITASERRMQSHFPLSKSALFKMLAQKRIIAMHNNSTYYTLKVNEGGMEKEIRVVRIPRDVFRWKPLQSIR